MIIYLKYCEFNLFIKNNLLLIWTIVQIKFYSFIVGTQRFNQRFKVVFKSKTRFIDQIIR